MTNEEFEPIRIRIMQEAYELADRNDTEGFNSVKVMCGDVQNLMHKEPLTDKEIDKAWAWAQKSSPHGVTRLNVFARAVEKAHGISAKL